MSTTQYGAYRALAVATRHAPASAAYPVATLVADVMARGSSDARRHIEGNLRVVLGDVDEARLQATVRAACRHLVWSYVELLRADGPDELPVAASVRDPVEATLMAASDGGSRPLVVGFAHVGAIEAFSRVALAIPELRFAAVAEHMRDERMFQLFRELRGRRGIELVAADEPRRILQLIEDGCSIIAAVDLDTTHHGFIVDFFGHPARIPSGAVKLAMRTGSPFVLANCWRTEPDVDPRPFDAELIPIDLPGDALREADVRANVETVVRHVEDLIRAHPDQWLAFHKRWKDQT